MNSDYSSILSGFSVDELRLDDRGKRAVKACADVLLNTSADFSTASVLSALLVAHLKRVEPTEAFAAAREENRPEHYSGDISYVAFFLLFLCEKARNIGDILAEEASCTHFSASAAGDPDVCPRCDERAHIPMPISCLRYEDAPPYHMGCLCHPLLLKTPATVR